MKLSLAQEKMLADLEQEGQLWPPTGNKQAGQAASAWWRTADSLVRRGLAASNGYALRKLIRGDL